MRFLLSSLSLSSVFPLSGLWHSLSSSDTLLGLLAVTTSLPSSAPTTCHNHRPCLPPLLLPQWHLPDIPSPGKVRTLRLQDRSVNRLSAVLQDKKVTAVITDHSETIRLVRATVESRMSVPGSKALIKQKFYAKKNYKRIVLGDWKHGFLISPGCLLNTFHMWEMH